MLVVRKANDGDNVDIFDWRNDALTRQMYHNTDYVEWSIHSNWFSSSLTNENRLLIMCEKKETLEKIAIVRFDVDEGRALVSINLNPNQRGKGLAKICLANSIDYFSKYFSDINKIVAEIKKENIASGKTFLGIGFEKYNMENEVSFYEKLLVISKNGN